LYKDGRQKNNIKYLGRKKAKRAFFSNIHAIINRLININTHRNDDERRMKKIEKEIFRIKPKSINLTFKK
jgi:hypothetical protein